MIQHTLNKRIEAAFARVQRGVYSVDRCYECDEADELRDLFDPSGLRDDEEILHIAMVSMEEMIAEKTSGAPIVKPTGEPIAEPNQCMPDQCMQLSDSLAPAEAESFSLAEADVVSPCLCDAHIRSAHKQIADSTSVSLVGQVTNACVVQQPTVCCFDMCVFQQPIVVVDERPEVEELDMHLNYTRPVPVFIRLSGIVHQVSATCCD